MCGRYTLTNPHELHERYETYNDVEDLEPSYNIAPVSTNPVIARRSPNGIYKMRWGLIPFWAKDPRIGYKMINARAEGIEAKSSFRKPIRTQRCLVPATGFYEWKRLKLEKKEEKFPWFFRVKDQEVYSFAGIYDVWKDAEGVEILSYSIITTEPNKTLAQVHDRMPVILKPEDENKYLSEDTDLKDILKLLKPFPDELMESWPVSTRVNTPRNDDPTLLDKVDEVTG